MPNQDGTGPAGRGPGTGRGLGRCGLGRGASRDRGTRTSGTGLAAAFLGVVAEGLVYWLSSIRKSKERQALPPSRTSTRLLDVHDDEDQPGR